jgi:predicted site-specific integrase-resolvase
MAVLMNTTEVCEFLGVNINNLNQIQFRGHIKWVEKKGKHVFYDREHVEAYKAKRDKRKKSEPEVTYGKLSVVQ